MKAWMIALFLSPTLALACLPSGDRLDASEKAEFAKDIASANRRCASTILKQIGDLSSDSTYVYESPGDNMVKYYVTGKKAMSITKVKVMGRIRYNCDKVTGLKRCM